MSERREDNAVYAYTAFASLSEERREDSAVYAYMVQNKCLFSLIK